MSRPSRCRATWSRRKATTWTRAGNYVGNGAYTLVEWIPNDHVTLDKNPRFYDAANVQDRPRRVLPDDGLHGGALRRLRAGELDIQEPPAAARDRLAAREHAGRSSHRAPPHDRVSGRQSRPEKPFDDVRVREALNLALDRETLTDRITQDRTICRPIDSCLRVSPTIRVGSPLPSRRCRPPIVSSAPRS